MWESAKRGDAAVLISEISDMKTGQMTQVFQKNPLPQCEVSITQHCCYIDSVYSLLYTLANYDIID